MLGVIVLLETTLTSPLESVAGKLFPFTLNITPEIGVVPTTFFNLTEYLPVICSFWTVIVTFLVAWFTLTVAVTVEPFLVLTVFCVWLLSNVTVPKTYFVASAFLTVLTFTVILSSNWTYLLFAFVPSVITYVSVPTLSIVWAPMLKIPLVFVFSFEMIVCPFFDTVNGISATFVVPSGSTFNISNE